MQEALRKMKEEEERLKREEEERMRQEELREQARLEQLRLEQERKERKKQKEKQRKERLKAEGKFLTTKQKQDRARAQAMIEALKAQGLDLPDVGEKKPRPGNLLNPYGSNGYRSLLIAQLCIKESLVHRFRNTYQAGQTEAADQRREEGRSER